MNKKEINKNNKLIAIFMGWSCSIRKSYCDKKLVLYKPDGTIFKYDLYSYLLNKEPWNAPMKFHKSRDWLMPVVEKIEKMYETELLLSKININSHYCELSLSKNFTEKNTNFNCIVGCIPESMEKIIVSTKLKAVYYVVIEFIKWYNKNE